MKKILSLLLCMAMLLCLAACKEDTQPPQDAQKAEPSKEDASLPDSKKSLKERLVPDFDTGNPEFYVYLTDGDSKRSLTQEPIVELSGHPFQPIVEISDDMALLGYTYLYKDGEELAQPLDLPFSYILSACVSPDKTKIAYYAKEEHGEDTDLLVALYDLQTKELSKIKSLAPEDYAEIPFFIPFVEWGDNDTLYFDSPRKNSPAIERYTLSGGTVELFAENASWPQISDDNSVITYIENSSYGSDSGRNFLIQSGSQEAEFPLMHPIAAISPNNTIYLIDYLNAKLLRLGADLTVEAEKQLEGILFSYDFEGDTLVYSYSAKGETGRVYQNSSF